MLLNPDQVADRIFVGLVMRMEFRRAAHGLLQDRVRESPFDADDDRLVLFVAHHDPVQSPLRHQIFLTSTSLWTSWTCFALRFRSCYRCLGLRPLAGLGFGFGFVDALDFALVSPPAPSSGAARASGPLLVSTRRLMTGALLLGDRLQPRNVAANDTHPGRVFELPRRPLEAQVELFFLELEHLIVDLVDGHGAGIG